MIVREAIIEALKDEFLEEELKKAYEQGFQEGLEEGLELDLEVFKRLKKGEAPESISNSLDVKIRFVLKFQKEIKS